MTESKTTKIHFIVIFLMTLLVGFAYIFAESRNDSGFGFPLDDPWIHLQFARNIVTGHGFSFNPGEPVAGSTSPLWTFLLAGVQLISKDATTRAIVLTKLLGIFLFGAAAIFAYLIALKILQKQWAALIVAICVVFTTPLDWGMVSGLEVPLYVLLTLSGIYCAVYSTNPKLKRLSPVLFALSVYARPECLLLFGFYFVDSVLFRRAKADLRALLIETAIYALCVTPYFIFNYSLSGSIFPCTFNAKAGTYNLFESLANGNARKLKYLILDRGPSYFADLFKVLFWSNPLLLFGVPLGLAAWIYRVAKKTEQSFLLVFIVVFYSFFIGVVAPFKGADFQTARYISNQIAATVILATIGFIQIIRFTINKKKIVGIIVGAIVGAIFLFNTVVGQKWMIPNYVSNVRSINLLNVKTGKWFGSHVPPNSLIAAFDIGAVGYFSKGRILDLYGLITPEMTVYFRKYSEDVVTAHLAAINRHRPDYITIFSQNEYMPLFNSFPAVFVAEEKNNTATEFAFEPEAKALFGIILLDVEVTPVASAIVTLKAKWKK